MCIFFRIWIPQLLWATICTIEKPGNQLILQSLLPQLSFYFQEFIFQMLSNKKWKSNLIAILRLFLSTKVFKSTAWYTFKPLLAGSQQKFLGNTTWLIFRHWPPKWSSWVYQSFKPVYICFFLRVCTYWIAWITSFGSSYVWFVGCIYPPVFLSSSYIENLLL